MAEKILRIQLMNYMGYTVDINARIYLAKDSTLDKKLTNKLAGFNELIEKSNELNFDDKFYSNMVNRLKD